MLQPITFSQLIVSVFLSQALQSDPDNPQFHTGLLNCLLNLGHLRTAITHVNGAVGMCLYKLETPLMLFADGLVFIISSTQRISIS